MNAYGKQYAVSKWALFCITKADSLSKQQAAEVCMLLHNAW